eukprot:TRINITY_DN1042_c0_g6_i1.p1 TRINITY_DN1042_c0_g6~~TRINITY_DN1042_c0_g6_i1.p1  ORF type:complete len:451 (+),score=119.93 TRINITY_DN1042_c0_g6_i1:76-1428(+)
MGAAASCVAGCVGSMCGNAMQGCLDSCCNFGKSSRASRIPHLIMLFLGVILALALKYWGGNMLVHLYYFDFKLCTTDRCLGNQAVYRISFTLFLFFVFHFLMACCSSTRSSNGGLWLFKTLAMAGVLVATFFMPNPFFDVFAEICRYVSFLFLLLQILALIDFGYSWNIRWVAREWFIPVLVSCFVLFVTSYILAGFFFSWFASGNGDTQCGTQKFFIGFTFAITAVVTMISVSNFSEHGALLPSGVVTAYSVFLLYSALSSDPSVCNSFRATQSSKTVSLIIGMLLAAFSMVKSAWDLSNANIFGKHRDEELPLSTSAPAPSSSSSSSNTSSTAATSRYQRSPTSEDDHSVAVDDKDRGHGALEIQEQEEDEAQQRKSDLFFYGTLVLSAMYTSMLLTNWGSSSESDQTQEFDVGWESVWIKIVSQWVTILLYAWTLVAPYLFPDRDFS